MEMLEPKDLAPPFARYAHGVLVPESQRGTASSLKAVIDIVAMIVGGVVCTSLAVAGAFATDLKIGYWIDSTPRNQQIWKFLGVIVAAVVVADRTWRKPAAVSRRILKRRWRRLPTGSSSSSPRPERPSTPSR